MPSTSYQHYSVQWQSDRVCADAEDSQTGPNVEHKDMDESDIGFAGDKPDPNDIPFTRQQSR